MPNNFRFNSFNSIFINHKKLFLSCLLIFINIFLVGCWDRDEPENLAFVMGTGFDYHEEEKLYEVTVQIADPTGIEGGNGLGGNGGGNGGTSVAVTSAKGRTPYHAVKNLQLHMSRKVFFGHNKILIISESLAKQGISPVLDFFDRERESRLIAFPMILDSEHDITEFFRTELPFEAYMAEGIERQITISIHERAIFPSRSLIETFNVLSMPGRETLIGKIKLGEQEDEDILGEEEAIRETTHLAGGAVFKNDKMQGWFDQIETTGWFWIHGRVQRGILIINCPVHDEHPISVEVYNSESQVTPGITDNENYRVDIDISAEGIIQDQVCPSPYEKESDLINSIENRAATAIKTEIISSIETAQEFESDIFGFGNAFYRKKPKIWDKIEFKWHSDIFQNLDIYISVDFQLRRSGLVTDPLVEE